MLEAVCKDVMIHCIERSTDVEENENGTVTGVNGKEQVVVDF